MSLGSKIAELRENKKMTRLDFAHKIQVSEKKLAKWEENKALPDIFNLKKIACALEISVSELYNYINGERLTLSEEKCYEDIAKYKKYSILSYVFLLLSTILIVFAVTKNEKLNYWHSTVLIFGGLALFLFAMYLEISQLLRLKLFKNVKEYRLEYRKVQNLYLTLFIVISIMECALVIIYMSV